MKRSSVMAQFFEFLRQEKKFWLIPIVVIFVAFGLLMVFAQSSAVALFIYWVLMPTRILGIRNYHDSAACLVEDTDVPPHRKSFTRKKHDANFPSRAVDYRLERRASRRRSSIRRLHEQPSSA